MTGLFSSITAVSRQGEKQFILKRGQHIFHILHAWDDQGCLQIIQYKRYNVSTRLQISRSAIPAYPDVAVSYAMEYLILLDEGISDLLWLCRNKGKKSNSFFPKIMDLSYAYHIHIAIRGSQYKNAVSLPGHQQQPLQSHFYRSCYHYRHMVRNIYELYLAYIIWVTKIQLQILCSLKKNPFVSYSNKNSVWDTENNNRKRLHIHIKAMIEFFYIPFCFSSNQIAKVFLWIFYLSASSYIPKKLIVHSNWLRYHCQPVQTAYGNATGLFFLAKKIHQTRMLMSSLYSSYI